MVNSSINVPSVINAGSSQEAVTIPHPQASLRMTFTSHILQRMICWSLPRSTEASKSPFAPLISSDNFRRREGTDFWLIFRGPLGQLYMLSSDPVIPRGTHGRETKNDSRKKGFGQKRPGWRLRQGCLPAIFCMYLSAFSVSPILTWVVAQAAHSPSMKQPTKNFWVPAKHQAHTIWWTRQTWSLFLTNLQASREDQWETEYDAYLITRLRVCEVL